MVITVREVKRGRLGVPFYHIIFGRKLLEILELYKKIADANFEELKNQKHELIGKMQLLLADIGDFIQLFLTLDFDSEELKREIVADMNDIANDIVQAIQNEDEVLLMDATANGLLAYMRMLLPEDNGLEGGAGE